MAFFFQKICVCEKIAVLLRPISRSRAVVARQAHNLKVGGSIPSSATKERFSRSYFLARDTLGMRYVCSRPYADLTLTLRCAYSHSCATITHWKMEITSVRTCMFLSAV